MEAIYPHVISNFLFQKFTERVAMIAAFWLYVTSLFDAMAIIIADLFSLAFKLT